MWGQDGEVDGVCHTVDWLFFFHMIHSSSLWQGVSFFFPFSFGILVYEKKNF